MSEEFYITPKAALDATADAIRTKTGSQASIEFTQDGFANAIKDIPSGGEDHSHDLDDVILIDYDGTVLHYYTKAEFLALSSLPANPTHSGLTSQGWNWSLADAKTYVTANGKLTIGQSYITNDGKNRFYVTIPADDLDFRIRWYQSKANGVELDWGDGSAKVTVSGTNNVAFQTHTYSSAGTYCITLEKKDGNLGFIPPFAGTTSGGGSSYQNHRCTKIELGNFTSFNNYCFQYLDNLESITIPYGQATTIASAPLASCFRLKALVIPSGFTKVQNTYLMWSDCRSIRFVSLPKSITSNMSGNTPSAIGLIRIEIPPDVQEVVLSDMNQCESFTLPSGVKVTSYSKCSKLKKIYIASGITSLVSNYATGCGGVTEPTTIPSTVTSTSSNTFLACGYPEFHFLGTTPPTAGASTIFTKSDDLKIYVPYSVDHSVLNAYKTATNWSTFADYIYEEPQS